MIQKFKPIVILFFIVFTACQRDKSVIIDNPTQEKIKLVIDDLSFEIDAYAQAKTILKGTQYILKINSKQLEFEVPKSDTFMLNPTKSIYVIEEVLYGENSWNIDPRMTNAVRTVKNKLKERDNEEKLMLVDTLQVGNYKLIGLFEKTNALVIAKKWEFGVLDAVPQQISVTYNLPTTKEGRSLQKTINEKMKSGAIPMTAPEGKIKVYREKDFLNEIKERNITSVNNK